MPATLAPARKTWCGRSCWKKRFYGDQIGEVKLGARSQQEPVKAS
jgi:hypothetical protein